MAICRQEIFADSIESGSVVDRLLCFKNKSRCHVRDLQPIPAPIRSIARERSIRVAHETCSRRDGDTRA